MKKRPLLRIIGFENRQVDLGRIDLDLAEIGIERKVEGQIAFQAVLQVKADAGEQVAAGAERISLLAGAEGQLAHRIGHGLEMAAGADAADAGQAGEARNKTVLLLGHPGEIILLVLALDGALEIDPPDVFVLGREAQLVVGDAHLHRPALVVDLGRALPDPVPGAVVPFVVVQGPVDDRAGGIDAERIAAAPVEIGIDGEGEPVGIEVVVAAAEQADDLSRLGVVQPGGHVQRLVVDRRPRPRCVRWPACRPGDCAG